MTIMAAMTNLGNADNDDTILYFLIYWHLSLL